MNYKNWTVWIFIVLLLLVALMMAFPSNFMLGIGTILLPVLIGAQAVIILKAGEQSNKRFSDGDWYEDK